MKAVEHKKNIENLARTLEEVLTLQSRDISPVDQETSEVVKRSLVLQASLLCHNVTKYQYLHAREEFGFGSDEFRELRQIFETYIGTTSRLSSRIEVDYLVSIPLMVLIGCMSAVRRADYIVEKGQTTSVAVNPKSIVVPLMIPSSGQVYASDIKHWVSPVGTKIAAPYEALKFREVDLGQYESLVFFDNVLTNESIPSFVNNILVPKYDKPKYRYYDPLSGNPKAFNGYKMSYVVPDPVMVEYAGRAI